MRRPWNRFVGTTMLVASVGAGAAAFQIDADVVTRVATTSGSLWVPAEPTGEVVRIDVLSGEVTGRVEIGDRGASLEVVERATDVVVVDRSAGRAGLVDPALHELVQVTTLPVADPVHVDIGPESVVVAAGNDVGVIDATLTTATAFDLGGGDDSGGVVSLVAHGDGGVAARADRLIEFGPEGPSREIAADQARLVRVGDRVVMVDATAARRLDGDELGCVRQTLEPGAFLTGHAEGWIAAVEPGGDLPGRVQIIDVENGWCRSVRVGDPGDVLGAAAVAGDRVFVPNETAGMVHIIDPETGTHGAVSVIGSKDLRVRGRGSHVAAFSADSRFVTVLDGGGVLHLVDTSVEERDLRAILSEDAAAAVLDGSERDDGVGVDGVDGDSDDRLRGARIDAAVLTATIANSEEPPPESQPERPPDPAPESPSDELVANFALSATTVGVGESVRFVDESSGSPDSWVWDFGDGTGAEGPTTEHAWGAPGTFTVTLYIGREDETAEVSLAITVVPAEVGRPPAANFSFTAAVVDVGDEIVFRDRSRGEIDRWRWDFGDGTSSSRRNVSKAWDRPGRYTVSLTVANEQGSDTASVVIEVVQDLKAPIAMIETATTPVAVGVPATFRAASAGGPASFSWRFGDGSTATGAEVTHVFGEEGTFTVTVEAQNATGSSVASVEVVVGPATLIPIARIASLPAVIEAGDLVTLSSLSTNGPEREEWSFGDGSTATGSVVSHVWSAPGTYVVMLTATNSAGSDSTTVPVEIRAALPPPVAVIGDHDGTPWVGEPTVFLDDSLNATGWLWDFGDGVTSSAKDPLHTFTTPGPTTVTLTVTNRNGTDTTSVTVDPRLRPFADFSASTTAPRVGQAVSFTDLSVNAVTWFWDFGDGTASTAENPQHAYAATGAYTVLLTVTNATDDPHTSAPLVINVDPAPPRLASLTVDENPATTLDPVRFTGVLAGGSGPVDRYRIDFGDGTPIVEGTSPTFVHTYGAAGPYTASMQARGPLGDWSAPVTLVITVNDPPPPLIGIAASVPTSAEVGPVQLSGEVLPGSGPIDAWTWTISGGGLPAPQVRSGREVTFDFTTVGVHTLSLRADGPVDSITVSQPIRIDPPPPPQIISLGPSATVVTTGDAVQFSPTVTGAVVTFGWDFENDGTFVTQAPPAFFTFTTPGSHDVWLRVTDAYGGQDLEMVTITVHDPPDVLLAQVPPGVVTTADLVTFTASEIDGDPVVRWDWEVHMPGAPTTFPDHGATLVYQFPSAGRWRVTATAVGVSGATGTADLWVDVVDP